MPGVRHRIRKMGRRFSSQVEITAYRLVHADGTYNFGPGKVNRYNLEMGYDTLDNIISKQQTNDVTQVQTFVNGIMRIFAKAPIVAVGAVVYLAVYLLAPALGIGSLCCNYCNFAAVPRLFGAAFTGADLAYFMRTAGLINLGLVVALGFLAKGGRAYCNLLCPIGALDSLANRLGVRFGKRVAVEASRCDDCGACAKVCPMWAIEIGETARIDPLACLPCRECEPVCPTGAIAYGRRPALPVLQPTPVLPASSEVVRDARPSA